MKTLYLEYIWIDGFNNLRSKVKIIEVEEDYRLNLPIWNFDGSSTGQAEGKESDIILKPVNYFNNPFINYCEAYLVLCECFNKDDTPHVTNKRNILLQNNNKHIDADCLFGIEQEYFILNRDKSPYKWLNIDDPGCGGQGPYYCSVGGDRSLGRNISERHLELCLRAGLKIGGTNAEVLASQWEYQIGPLTALEVSDQIWISRYILHRVSEEFDCAITFEPKPLKGNWNGSGGHTNFSTRWMRGENGVNYIIKACEKLEKKHLKHIFYYGQNNEERLTGNHETSSIKEFNWGIGNRGTSIRIPLNVYKDGKGYLEDRRPGANMDPYEVTNLLMETVLN